MTLAEIVQEVSQLPQGEQIALAHMILEGLTVDEGISPPVIDTLPFLSLAGVLNPDGKEYTDEDVENMLASYLEEKYL